MAGRCDGVSWTKARRDASQHSGPRDAVTQLTASVCPKVLPCKLERASDHRRSDMQSSDSELQPRDRFQRRRDPARGAACLLGLLVLISGPHHAGAEEVTASQSLSSEQLQHKHVPRVAIIGAGIGGASAAYFLNKLLDGQVNIHV